MSTYLDMGAVIAAGLRVGLAGNRLRVVGLPAPGPARDHLVEIAARHRDALLAFLGSSSTPPPSIWLQCPLCLCEWKIYYHRTCACRVDAIPVPTEWWEADPIIYRMVREGSNIDDALEVAERLSITAEAPINDPTRRTDRP